MTRGLSSSHLWLTCCACSRSLLVKQQRRASPSFTFLVHAARHRVFPAHVCFFSIGRVILPRRGLEEGIGPRPEGEPQPYRSVTVDGCKPLAIESMPASKPYYPRRREHGTPANEVEAGDLSMVMRR